MNLLDLTKEAKALEELMLAAVDPDTGEVVDQEGILDRWLQETEGNLAAKLESIARLHRELEARAAVRKAEEEKLAKRRKAIENQAKRLKDWTKFCLESNGTTKIEAGPYTFAIQANGGKQSMRPLWTEPGQLPTKFLDVVPTPNNERIRAALEAGDPEITGLAELLPRGTSLRIK
jgi:hypothetical protein